MRYDYSTVNETESYVSIPAGTYVCKVAEVRPGRSRDGSEQWSLRLEVQEGEYAGRTAAWDSLTWSERGVARVKLVLRVFGFDVDGELEVQPDDLLELPVRAEVQVEAWEEPSTGRRIERMRVPYNGYAAFDLIPANAVSAGGRPDAGVPAGVVGEASVDQLPASREPGTHGGTFDDTPF